ncbi:MAG: hypothetical protein ACO3N7_08355, partial [Kiritimatiellia bacterium]
ETFLHTRSGTVPLKRWVLLGLLAGIGWWLSPLLVSVYLTLAVLGLLMLREKLFWKPLLAAAPAFVLGATPWWLWNLFHSGKSLMMFGTEGNPGLIKGLELFVFQRVPTLLDLKDFPFWIRWVPVLLVLFTLGYGILFVVRRSGRRSTDASWYVAASLTFLLISALLFTRSKLAWAPAIRYLLPLVPAFAVLLGLFSERLSRTRLRQLGWIPLLLLMFFHALRLPTRLQEQKRFADFKQEALRFGEQIAPLGVRHIYTMYQVPFANHGLNFVLNEAYVFTDFQRERYGPYARSMELADEVGVLNDHGGFSAFLGTTRGSARTTGTPRLHLHYEVRPPEKAVQTLPATEILSIQDEQGHDLTRELTDSDLETGVRRDTGPQRIRLRIRLKSEQEIRGIRLPNRPSFQGQAWEILSGEETLLERKIITGYYWSEDRPYHGGGSYRLEARFEPRKVDEITLIIEGQIQLPVVGIPEIDLLVAPDSDSGAIQAEALFAKIEQLQARGAYADRRISALLWDHFGDDFLLVRDIHLPFAEQPVLNRQIEISPDLPWILPAEEEGRIRSILDPLSVPYQMEKTDGLLWVRFPEEIRDSEWRHFPGLYWAGNRVLKHQRFETAAFLVRLAEAKLEEGKTAQALRLSLRALELKPDFQPAMALKMKLLSGEEQAAVRKRYTEIRTPDQAAEIRFSQQLRMLGYQRNPRNAVPGEKVQMRYFWQVGPDFVPQEWAVFVHIKSDGKIVTQGDHVLLPEVEVSPEALDQVWVQRKDIQIPADCTPGELEIWLGVYRRSGRGERLKPRTEFESRRSAVLLPEGITVHPLP